MAIKLELDNLRDEVAPLYFKYTSQVNPQPAFIEIDENGVVTAGVNGEIGNGVPSNVWHKVDLRVGCSSLLHGNSLIEFLEGEVGNDLLRRIHNGHSVDWDGSNHVGSLTEDAENAILELENELHDVQSVTIYSAEEWIENDSIDHLWPVGTTLTDAAENASIANEPFQSIEGDMERAIIEKAFSRQPWPSEWAKNGRWDIAKAIVESHWDDSDTDDLCDEFDKLFEFPLNSDIDNGKPRFDYLLIVDGMIKWLNENKRMDLSWLPSEVKKELVSRRMDEKLINI